MLWGNSWQLCSEAVAIDDLFRGMYNVWIVKNWDLSRLVDVLGRYCEGSL
jgi:hypothetical protein